MYKSQLPLVIVEVKCNRDLSTTDDTFSCMNEEPNSTAIEHMSHLPTRHMTHFILQVLTSPLHLATELCMTG